jgi:hypothetical protein
MPIDRSLLHATDRRQMVLKKEGRAVESEKAGNRPVEEAQADGDDQPGENRQGDFTDCGKLANTRYTPTAPG